MSKYIKVLPKFDVPRTWSKQKWKNFHQWCRKTAGRIEHLQRKSEKRAIKQFERNLIDFGFPKEFIKA